MMDATQERQTQTAELTAASVRAMWLQNSGAGIGGATLAALACWWLGADAMTTLRWSVTVGGVLFGALMILRSAIDEIVDWSDWQTVQADIAEMIERIEALQDENAHLRRQVAFWQSQRSTFKAGDVVIDADGEPVPSRAPDNVRNDAAALLRMNFELGKWPAKDATCARIGWETTRWTIARDELQRHGIIATVNRQTVVQVASLAEGLAKLDGATVQP